MTFDIPGTGFTATPLPKGSFWDSVQKTTKKKGESGLCNHPDLIEASGMHPFVDAAYQAYARHYPLSISPDDINLMIAQGMANHINQNAEALRSKIVAHEGKMVIKVRRDDFVKGRMENPWEQVFPEFTRQIREHLVGNVYDMIVGDFTTTGPVEKAASEVVLLDAVQNYFSLQFQTCCGIPRFTLTGTPDDWKKVRERATHLDDYGLGWWQKELMPLLDEFVFASEGHPSVNFWASFFKKSGGSGGPYIGGNFIRLFPYLWIPWKKEYYVNEFEYEARMGGPGTENFPGGLSAAPFKWFYYLEEFDMEFVAGFVGVGQDADLTLHPAIGWVVREVE